MFALVASLLAVSVQEPLDPNRLPIGAPGVVVAQPGRITATADGSAVTADMIAAAARTHSFIFLGEQHATAPHQQMHANIIDALVRDGRKVVVGLEMYTRPKQEFLNAWSAGKLTEDEFLTQSDWKGQWGFPFAFYRPVFDVVRKNQLPLLALNVPRDWVRAVGKGGFAALTPDQAGQLPAEMSLTNENHRKVFDALMGGHPGMTEDQMKNIYSAQVLWDEGMADTVAKDISTRPKDPKTIYVIIAGSGHVMFGQGINYRLERRGFPRGLNVVMLDESEPAEVSRGLADFVYVSPKARAERQ